VLSGGGARGAFQAGVWQVLRTDPRGLGRAPDVISGTSAGALNAVLIASGLSPEGVLEFWLDLARSPPVRANDAFFKALGAGLRRMLLREPLRPLRRRVRDARLLVASLRKHAWYLPSGIESMLLEFWMTARFDNVSDLLDGIATTYLFDTSPLRARLERVMGKGGLRDTSVRLAINTVDVRTGGVIRIVNHRPDKRPDSSSQHYRYEPVITPDIVLASASIPLLFNPVRLGSIDLWDGGLLVNTPIAPVVALGARRIVPVLVTPRSKGGSHPLDTFGHAIERLADGFLENAYNNDRKLLLDRNALAKRLPDEGLHAVDLFRAIRPASSRVFNAGSYLFFEERALIKMYEAGQRAARAWLDDGPQLDHRGAEG
jgi:predicted acylesterase/phospholipase RssA